MKFKLALDRFPEAVRALYGHVKQTKAALARGEESVRARGDSFNTAMAAAFGRQMNHNIRASYRKNGRGLPSGIGPHMVRAARRLKNYLSSRSAEDETVIAESRIHAADTTLERVKSNAELRAKHRTRRGSKAARRAAPHGRPRAKSMNLKEWCNAHTLRMRENQSNGRIPYRRPAVAA